MIEADLYMTFGATAPASIFLPGSNSLSSFLNGGYVYNWWGPYASPNSGSGMVGWTAPQSVSIFMGAAAQPADAFIGVRVVCARVLNTNIASVSGTVGSFGEDQSYHYLSNDQATAQFTGWSTSSPLVTNPVAVASLPAAALGNTGARLLVNNANSTTFGSIVAGGGTNIVPVYSDGTNWRIG
jgi:hypothetical protein